MRAAKIHPIKQNGRGAREGNLVNTREGLVNPRGARIKIVGSKRPWI